MIAASKRIRAGGVNEKIQVSSHDIRGFDTIGVL